MAIELRFSRGTTAQHNTFTGAQGEVTVDTTKNSLVVHDGVTTGGHPVKINIVGTVSQSGGIPTGAVVERGENSNGTYIRFADGTQICYILKASATYAVNLDVGVLYRSEPQTITLPAAYHSSHGLTTSITCNGFDGRVWGGVASPTPTTVNFLIFAGLSLVSTTEGFSIITFGRWF